MPENKEPQNAVAKKEVALSNTENYLVSVIKRLDKFAEETSLPLTDYGRQCANNVLGALIVHCRQNEISMKKIDTILLEQQVRHIAYTELNIATTPAECYFDIRKVKMPKEDGTVEELYSIKIAPQGAGYEKLVRKFGLNVAELMSPWLVREGDEFTLGGWDGDKQTPPTWKRKSLSGKVVAVVYPVKKVDETMEFLMADRESIKANLIAQIRQNKLYGFKQWVTDKNGKRHLEIDTKARDEYYLQLEKDFEGKTADECLELEKYRADINPTYTSGGSKEAMVIRKMKNNALKNYPKEYNNAEVAKAVLELSEDYDETLQEKAKPQVQIKKEDVIENVEAEVDEIDPEAIQDFDVDDDEPVEDSGVKEDAPSIDPSETKEEAPTPTDDVDEDDPEKMF